jgi:fermentation-respiration switch protein FrsA (DUF1100 family)
VFAFGINSAGYGRSTGKPTEQGTYLDARAAYEWLTEVREIRPSQIALFGRSLGGSVAAQLRTVKHDFLLKLHTISEETFSK